MPDPNENGENQNTNTDGDDKKSAEEIAAAEAIQLQTSLTERAKIMGFDNVEEYVGFVEEEALQNIENKRKTPDNKDDDKKPDDKKDDDKKDDSKGLTKEDVLRVVSEAITPVLTTTRLNSDYSMYRSEQQEVEAPKRDNIPKDKLDAYMRDQNHAPVVNQVSARFGGNLYAAAAYLMKVDGLVKVEDSNTQNQDGSNDLPPGSSPNLPEGGELTPEELNDKMADDIAPDDEFDFSEST